MSHSLIIGANGLIGNALACELKQIDSCYSYSTKQANSILKNSIFLNLSHDVSNWQVPDGITTAYFCAFHGNTKSCRENPVSSQKINVSNTLKILKVLLQAQVHVLFLSTTQVFDGNTPYRKTTDPLSPLTEYGKQKAEVEQAILSYPNISIVRLSKVLGKRIPLFEKWIDSLQRNIAIYPFTDLSIAPIDSEFVARSLIQIASKKIAGIHHLSGDQDISYHSISKYIVNELGLDKNLIREGSVADIHIPKAEAPTYTTLDTDKTYHELNIPHTKSMETIINYCNLLKMQKSNFN